MTEQQFDILKANKHVYDTWKLNLTVNTEHPAISEINGVYNEIYGHLFNTSCGTCVADALETIYGEFKKHAEIWQ